MARDMSQHEKDFFQLVFPAMNVDLQPRVTAEATPTYNCIAWTLGITNRWINPVQSLAEWDLFYAPSNYVRADAGQIAIWRSGMTFTHGCVANADQGFNWESKCGQALRTLHHIGDLVGNAYGQVIAYYQYQAPASSAPCPSRSVFTATPVNEQHKAALMHKAVKDVPTGVREDFYSLFNAWKKTWFEGAMAVSSNSRDRSNTHSYRKLLDMGPEILPLVVKELDDPANFMAVQLYEDLQTDPTQRAALKAIPHDPLSGLQGQAQNIVQSFLSTR